MATDVTQHNEVIILQDDFHIYPNKKAMFNVTLTSSHITCRAVQESNGRTKSPVLFFKDIIGCDLMKGKNDSDTSAYLTVYAYPHKKKFIGKRTARTRETLTLDFNKRNSFEENQKDARHWKTAITALLHGIIITDIQDLATIAEPSPRRMLVLVNPFSGPGRALQIFQQRIVAIFAEAGIHYNLVITEYPNHAKDIVKKMTLGEFYGIVIVSGDGLIYEVVNGLMEREDWQRAIKTPIGCLPGGSGNALCCSINRESGEPWTDNAALHSAFVIAKHQMRAMDLVAVDTIDKRVYSFLSVTWGLMADIDLESERFRSLGAARFTVEAIARIVNLRQYRGRLSYLPIEGEIGMVHRPGLKRSTTLSSTAPITSQTQVPQRSASVCEMPSGLTHKVMRENSVVMEQQDSDLVRVSEDLENDKETEHDGDVRENGATNIRCDVPNDLPGLAEPIPGSWQVLEDNFIHVTAAYLPLLGPDTLLVPDARLHEGVIYLTYTRMSNTSKKQLLSSLSAMETGNHLKDPSFEIIKVKAFRLEPLTTKGQMCVDGERVSYGPIQAQVLPGLANIMSL